MSTVPRKPSGRIDTENISVDPESFTPSNSFLDSVRNGKLKGIFPGEAIKECFNGDIRQLKDHKDNTALLEGELHGVKLGLVVDLDNEVVITGWVLSCNSVSAYESGLWDAQTVRRMSNMQHDHWAKFGNKQTWHGSENEQKSYHDGRHKKFS